MKSKLSGKILSTNDEWLKMIAGGMPIEDIGFTHLPLWARLLVVGGCAVLVVLFWGLVMAMVMSL